MDRARADRSELIFHGIPASPGIAIGEAFVVNVENLAITEDRIDEDHVESEIKLFESALSETEAELDTLHRTLEDEMGEEHAKILDSHRLILADQQMKSDTIGLIRDERFNAAFAFSQVLDKVLTAFMNIKDGYLRERAEDIRDVKRRVTRHLLGQKVEGLANLRKKAIVVAKNLTPSDTAGLKKKYVLAFVSDIGGSTSHAAILARSQSIPAVVGLDGFSTRTRSYDMIIVDGNTGQVILNPTPETVVSYREARVRFLELERELLILKDYPAVTLDGRTIELSGNIENEDEVDDVISHGAKGIGLFRTEYFFITRDTLPSEEEQYRFYSKIVRRIAPDPVIIRTLDVGGDKIAQWVVNNKEANPFMGWRGIRFTLARKDIFRAQLRAIFRAAAHGRVRIMFPMISVMEEVLAARAICEEVKEDLKQERYQIGEDVEIGIMIETPSAVAIADRLAHEVDFFSIGTNDLIQYALAVDRGNSRISYLYDALHPSILRLINDTVRAAHKGNIWVGICGEMPARVRAALVVIGLGIDELSASPVHIPEIKKIIRSITYDEAKLLVKKALQKSTLAQVRELLDQYIREKRPELQELVREVP
ncbi:MAG TPA: phosphoenolpyruvate--protein phosphotransferase [Patescibacteria group bacterium]|nr:phosphoenolpyruvate--protein phosphotransferase [Patescibacteria group bacterium]